MKDEAPRRTFILTKLAAQQDQVDEAPPLTEDEQRALEAPQARDKRPRRFQ